MGVRVRTIVLGLVVTAFSVRPAAAQDLEEAVRSFDDGNQRYRQGDHRGALESYSRAVDAGFVSGALFLNMGNSYYRLDDVGNAVRYYERAYELIPQSDELRHNLQIVRSETVDQFSRLPQPFWTSAWRWVVQTFGADVLLAAGILFYFVAAGTVALRIRSGRTSWRRRVLAVAASLAIVLITAGFAASFREESMQRGVILVDEVPLLEAPEGPRSGPDIHEGLVLDVIGSEETWFEVRLPNGVKGWVRSEAVGII